MITVRYPNGQAITYNDAAFLDRSGTDWRILTERDGRLICCVQASAGAICEFRTPCKVEQALVSNCAAARYLSRNPSELRKLPGQVLMDLKRHLRSFNGRSWIWS